MSERTGRETGEQTAVVRPAAKAARASAHTRAVSGNRVSGRRDSGAIVKRSVSLDADIDQELTLRFGRGGKSRFLNSAARDALARVKLTELLRRYDEEVGPVSEAVHSVVAQLPRPR